MWHGPSSCTKRISVLADPNFLGAVGLRTQFIIQLTQGQARDITKYSFFQGTEDEVLIPPGCRFRVEDVLALGAGLTQIQLVELPSKMWILDISRSSSSSGHGVPSNLNLAFHSRSRVLLGLVCRSARLLAVCRDILSCAL